MASILESLGSFDPDIRFMVLNDLANGLAHYSLQLDPQLIEPVVRRLGDASADVQNQAIKVLALFATSRCSRASILPELLLKTKMPESVRGVALKQVIQAGVSLEVKNFKQFLERNRVFKTVEGVNALTELVKRQELSQASSEDVTRHFLNLLAGQTQVLGSLSIIEGLSLTIPRTSQSMWRADVEPLLRVKLSDPLYMGLLEKLAGHVPDDWLVPGLSTQLIALVQIPFNENTNFSNVEAALKSMSSLLRAAPEFSKAHVGDIEPVAAYAVAYRDSELGSDGSLMWDSDDEDDADESVGIRLAASQVINAVFSRNSAVRSPHAESLLQALQKALEEEEDRVVLTALYTALDSALSSTANSLRVARHYASRAMERANFTLTELAMRTTARIWTELQSTDERNSFENNPIFDLFEGVMHQKMVPPNISELIALLKPAMEHPARGSNESDRRLRIISWLFEGDLFVKLTAEAQLLAISWLSLEPSFEIFDRVAHTTARLTGGAKAAALKALPKLTSDSHALVSIELNAVREDFELADSDVTATACFQALQEYADEHLRNPSEQLIEADALSVIGSVSRYLQKKVSLNQGVSEETDSSIQYICGELLVSLPASVANSAIAALAHIHSAPVVSRLQKLIANKDEQWLSAPNLVNWAIEHRALALVERVSRVRPGATVQFLERSNSPQIHAASTSFGGQWELLATKYAFDKTRFTDLSTEGLEVLLALNYRRCKWDWYSLDEVASGVSYELQSKVLGTLIALQEEESTREDTAHWFLDMEESLREPAFVAYAAIAGVSSWKIMLKHPELRFGSIASSTIVYRQVGSPGFSEFAELFAEDPALLLASAKEYTGLDIQNSMRSIYAADAGAEDVSGSMRGEALAIASARPGADVEAILEFATGNVLKPDPRHVHTVSIGPFKHKVDSDLPLRLTVLEVLYRHLITSAWGDKSSQVIDAGLGTRLKPIAHRVVNSVVSYALHDEHEVKVSGYKLLVQLADVFPSALLPYTEAIQEAVNEDIGRKLKDNAVKQDIERNAEVVRVASALREKLAI